MTGRMKLACGIALVSFALAIASYWCVRQLEETAKITERIARSGDEIGKIIDDESIPMEIRDRYMCAMSHTIEGDTSSATAAISEAERLATVNLRSARIRTGALALLFAASLAAAVGLLTYRQRIEIPIGVRIRDTRLAKRMTQRALANKTGTNQTKVWRVETGKCRPTKTMLHWLRRNEVPRQPGNPTQTC
jgi:DNA-binding XRE family transcriptional regulator